MSNVVWNNSGANPFEPGEIVLVNALGNGQIQLPTTIGFFLHDNLNLALFHENFVVHNGAIQSGTITGFDAYYDPPSPSLLQATGYSIDFNAFKPALADWQAVNLAPMTHLIFGNPTTVNGSGFSDFAEIFGSLSESVGGLSTEHFYGNGGKDHMVDGDGNDFLFGGSGDDELGRVDIIFGDSIGGGGNDFLSGDTGNDELNGGTGNDLLSGGDGKDDLNGFDGSDTADYSEKLDFIEVTLNGPTNAIVKVGGVDEDTVRSIENVNGGLGNDKITGDGLVNRLVGNGGDDTLGGMDGNDVLEGRDGNDRVNGGRGNDQVSGGLGKDKLKSGPGSDTFVFDTALGAGNVDRIKDLRGTDHIALDTGVFATLPLGALKAKFFHAGIEAADGSDRVIYDKATGRLFYDGDGKGGAQQVLFAKVFDHGLHHPTLHAGDLLAI